MSIKRGACVDLNFGDAMESTAGSMKQAAQVTSAPRSVIIKSIVKTRLRDIKRHAICILNIFSELLSLSARPSSRYVLTRYIFAYLET